MQTKKTTRSATPAANNNTSRREALQFLGAVGVGAIVGCSQTSDGGGLAVGSGIATGLAGSGAGTAGGSAGNSAARGGAGNGAARGGKAGEGAAGGGGGSPSVAPSGEAGSRGTSTPASGGGGGTAGTGGSGEFDAAAGAGASGDGSVAPAAAPECVLTAEQEEGPFYVAMQQIRNDLTDGKQGVPLDLTFTLMDVKSCKPLANAAVDIWHCDYTGGYSDASMLGSSGQPYHRGIQITDGAGKVTFKTFFPGWYPARTIHIHIKVHVGGMANGAAFSGGHVSHTGNVFFPQELNDAMAAVSPYKGGDTQTRKQNTDDMVWTRQNGSKYVCSVSGSATSAVTASIVLGVDPMATPALIGIHN